MPFERKWTETRVAQIFAMMDDDMSAKEIAAVFRSTPQMIRHVARAHGRPFRPSKAHVEQEDGGYRCIRQCGRRVESKERRICGPCHRLIEKMGAGWGEYELGIGI